jgi:NADPH:quinone reductase-like Zn-dependent oxidoreductase
VNRTDDGFLRAHPFVVRFFSGLSRPRRTILGCEFAGDVEAVGSGVTAFAVVYWACPPQPASSNRRRGRKTVSRDRMVTTIPAGLSYEQAAASTEVAHYALRYVRALRVGDGTRVLVHGATGAIARPLSSY